MPDYLSLQQSHGTSFHQLLEGKGVAQQDFVT